MARLKALSDQAQGVPRNMTVGRYKLDMDVFNFEYVQPAFLLKENILE